MKNIIYAASLGLFCIGLLPSFLSAAPSLEQQYYIDRSIGTQEYIQRRGYVAPNPQQQQQSYGNNSNRSLEQQYYGDRSIGTQEYIQRRGYVAPQPYYGGNR